MTTMTQAPPTAGADVRRFVATPVRPSSPVGGTQRRKRLDPARGGRRARMLFLLPAGLFLAVFSIYPLIQLCRMAVSDVTPATLGAAWKLVGFANVVKGWVSGATPQAIIRTLIFVVIVTILGMGIGFAGAVALRTKGRWSSILLALMVFVWALPPVVNGSVWKFLLGENGLFNGIIMGLHLADRPVPFLFDPSVALISVALVNSFAVIPFNALVYRAAMMNIDPEVFEAAQIDGANRWQEVRHILSPMARPTSLVLLVLTLVYGFRSFDYIYVMTAGGPGTATNTLPFLGYMQAFVRYDYGLGAATSVLTLLGVLVLAVVYTRSIRKEEGE